MADWQPIHVIAERLTLTTQSVRSYISRSARGFPSSHRCDKCQGTGTVLDWEEVAAWRAANPYRKGGGQYRKDPSAAAKKGWDNRLAPPIDSA